MYHGEFLICFEAWAKLAQQWLMCGPPVRHFELINKELMLLVIIMSALTAPSGPKSEMCSTK